MSYIKKIKEILSKRKKYIIDEPNLTKAAVLIPIFEKEGKYHIIFTKRTEKVEHHKGEISFLGGVYDKGDKSLLQTALRESFEELGIKPSDVEILGELDDITTITNFIISPFVGVIPYPYNFIINKDEIDQVLEIPIFTLLEKSNFWEEKFIYDEKEHIVYFYKYKENIIWGATGKILKQFLEITSNIS